MRALLFLCMTGVLSAQVLRVEQSFGGMECASCADFVKNKLEKNPGVASVQIDAQKGVVTVDLKPDGGVKPQLIRDWVQQSGYQIKETTLTVRGTVEMDRGVMSLNMGGANKLILLDHDFLLREQVRRKVELTGKLEKAKLGEASVEVLGVKTSKPAK
ncbi:MAG: heavy-metal-associated domain-containing protein [Bryobacterales bacterium]|nr:heavy-metal-associated domain-containing protein [Bryobacterales bacterium]